LIKANLSGYVKKKLFQLKSIICYKNHSKDWEDPLAHIHFSVEGPIEFTSILFVPRRPPFDMNEANKKNKKIMLYGNNELIMDDCDYLITEYLGFIIGIVDVKDLSNNTSSSESKIDRKILKVLKENIIEKCLELFQTITDQAENFKKFYEAFGKSIKLGIIEDEVNRKKLTELLRFYSSKSGEVMISLKDYLGRNNGLKQIFYIIGESIKQVSQSPYVEQLKIKGIEVLYLFDSIDEKIMLELNKYQYFTIVNCSKKEEK